MKSQKMPAEKDPVSSVYHREGPAPMKEVIPLSIQHVIAMIIGCMTPAVIVANCGTGCIGESHINLGSLYHCGFIYIFSEL